VKHYGDSKPIACLKGEREALGGAPMSFVKHVLFAMLRDGTFCIERDAGAVTVSQIDLPDVFGDAADGVKLAV